MFTLTETETKTETDKKWVVWDCVEVFTLTEAHTVTDANGFQTHFIGLGLCQCEHTSGHRTQEFEPEIATGLTERV